MKRSQFLRRLEDIVDAAPSSFKESDKLTDVGWESLSYLEFHSLVEAELNSGVTLDQVLACATVADLVALVAEKLTD